MRPTAILGALAALTIAAAPLHAQGTLLRAQPSGRTVVGGLIPLDAAVEYTVPFTAR